MEKLFDLILTICAIVMTVAMTAVVILIVGFIIWTALKVMTS